MKFFVKNEAGYSLISTSILVVVLGLGVASGAALYQNQDAQKKYQKNRDVQSVAKKSLEDYLAKNGRYPCPAPLDAAVDSVSAGKEVSATCPDSTSFSGTYDVIGRGAGHVRIGALPTRTLNIDDAAGLDAWGSKIIYAVTSAYARPGIPTGDDGAISIVDSSGTDVTSTPGNVIYTIVLPGSDKRGMYSMEGTQDPSVCDLTVPSGQNCDFSDATFYSSITQLSDNGSAQQYTAALDYVSSHSSYTWNTSGWSPCTCGSTTQTRTVGCVEVSTGFEMPDITVCSTSGPMPAATQSCTPVCPPPPPPWVGGGGETGYDTDGDGDIDTSDPSSGGTYIPDGTWDPDSPEAPGGGGEIPGGGGEIPGGGGGPGGGGEIPGGGGGPI